MTSQPTPQMALQHSDTPGDVHVVGRRVAGFFLDLFIFGIPAAISWFGMATEYDPDSVGPGSGGFQAGDTHYALEDPAAWLRIFLTLVLLYWVLLPGITGWTPAKRALGLRVVGHNAQPSGIWRALVRFLVGIVDSCLFGVGFIVAILSKSRRRIADRVAGTWVIRAT